MPSVTIPLVGNANRRGFSSGANNVSLSKDQRFTRTYIKSSSNPITKSGTVTVEKWPGWVNSSGVSFVADSYNYLKVVKFTALFSSPKYFLIADNIVRYGSTGQNECGTIDGSAPFQLMGVIDTIINGEYMFLFTVKPLSGAYAYYLPISATDESTTFTGDTSNTSKTITNVSSTSGLYVGQKVSGTGITSGSRIETIGAGTITITIAATATNSGVTITREHIAKIIDADFPANIRGGFVVIDGIANIMTLDGRIYSSDINSISSWGASNYLNANIKPDEGRFLLRNGNEIMAFGSESIQFFYNSGNASGSPLQRRMQINEVGAGFVTLTSYSECENYKFFVSSSRSTNCIYIMIGVDLKKISTPDIDAVINYTDPFIQSFKFAGYTYLLVYDNNTSSTYQYLYCVELDLWMETNFPYGIKISQIDQILYAVAYSNSSGKLYTITLSGSPAIAYNDDGTYYSMTVQTSKVDFGTDVRKFIKKVTLIGSDVQDDITYLDLDGATGNYANTPDSAAASITGDIDIRSKVALDDWTPSGNSSFITKYNSTGNQKAYGFRVISGSTGRLNLYWSNNGSADISAQSTASPTVTNGAILWVRATLDVDNGASGYDVNFYTSIDGATWTQLGATVTGGATTSIFDSTASIEVGSVGGGTQLADGKIYYAEVRSGIGGSAVAKFDPSNDADPGDTSFTSSTGEVWTINGTATLVNGQIATLEYSDDDYATWTVAGTFDMTQTNPFIPRCGSHQAGRAWRLTHSENTAFRAQALKFDYDLGTS